MPVITTQAPFTQLFLSFRKAPSDAQNTRTGHGPLDWQYLLPPSYRSNDHLTIERHGNAADALPKFNVFARALMDCVATQVYQQQTNTSSASSSDVFT
jgi:hypothetical protein